MRFNVNNRKEKPSPRLLFQIEQKHRNFHATVEKVGIKASLSAGSVYFLQTGTDWKLLEHFIKILCRYSLVIQSYLRLQNI